MSESHYHPHLREPARPAENPWHVVSRVMADLGHAGIKTHFGPEARLGEAAQLAAALLEALGVRAVIPDDEGDQA